LTTGSRSEHRGSGAQKDDESIIRKHLRPAFGAMKVRDVGVEEVDSYVNEKIDVDELSDKTVGNHVTLLATMLRLAMTFKVPWLTMVPKFRKPKVGVNPSAWQTDVPPPVSSAT
jgi:hypothetical protein